MNKICHSSFATSFLALSCLLLTEQPLPVTAQILGENQQKQEVPKVEEISAPADTISKPDQQQEQQEEQFLEQRERQLDSELNLEEKNPGEPKLEEVPNPPESVDDNVPFQPPLDETEIEFPTN